MTAQEDAQLAVMYIKMLIVMTMEYWIMLAVQLPMTINGLSFLQRDVLTVGVQILVNLLNVQQHFNKKKVIFDRTLLRVAHFAKSLAFPCS